MTLNASKILSTLILALLPFVATDVAHEEVPHGEPSEELVERHHGSRAGAAGAA
jgi:hypothetical protein